MQLLSETYKEELAKLLYYLQRFGDLNPKILGAIARIKNAEELVSFLKKNFEYNLYPYVYEDALGLRKYFFVIYTRKRTSLVDIYNIFDGIIGYALRDLFRQEKIYLLVYFNRNLVNLVRFFDYLLDNKLIYHYEYLGVAKRSLPYPLDYFKFNFEKKEFEGIGRIRLPFENPPLYDDFSPDYYDVVILGKKQEIAYMNLKEISEALKIPFRDVLYHYQKHIVGKGLVIAYNVQLNTFHYRLQVIFEKEETAEYLTKIPSLFLIYRLQDDNHKEIYIAHIWGNYSQLVDYVGFIKEAKYLFNDNVEVTIHPYTKDMRYYLGASIPYEHFTKEGRWDFNVERMILKAEKFLNT